MLSRCLSLLFSLLLSGLACLTNVRSAPIPPAPRDTVENWTTHHEEFVTRAKAGKIDILLMGDSITHRWPDSQWGDYFKPLVAEHFGIEGDLAENLHWRILNGEFDGLTPKVVVLLIGTNNVPRPYSSHDIADTVGAVVGAIQTKSPSTKVLVLGLFPRNELASNIMRDRITLINEYLAKLDNGKNVRFLDLGPKLLQPDGSITRQTSPDFLHPSPDTYVLLMKDLGPMVKQMAAGDASATP